MFTYTRPRPKIRAARYLFKCRRKKSCGHVWAIDYPEVGQYEAFRTVNPPRMVPHWPHPQSVFTVQTDRSIGCPLCGDTEPLIERIKGTLAPDVPCDARCTSAKGHICSCSCGGKNHGSDHAHH